MGGLNKQVFRHFAEFECDRQLFIDLGDDDPAWMTPTREVLVDPWSARSASGGLAELGKVYERSVYELLLKNPCARFRASASTDAPVVEAPLDLAALTAAHATLTAPGAPDELYLLEHQWPTAPAFTRYVFGLPPDAALPVNEPGDLRPDLHVIGNGVDQTASGDVHEVMPDGSLRALPQAERATRLGINVLDIKHTHEQGVGRGHFIELLYYAVALQVMTRWEVGAA